MSGELCQWKKKAANLYRGRKCCLETSRGTLHQKAKGKRLPWFEVEWAATSLGQAYNGQFQQFQLLPPVTNTYNDTPLNVNTLKQWAEQRLSGFANLEMDLNLPVISTDGWKVSGPSWNQGYYSQTTFVGHERLPWQTVAPGFPHTSILWQQHSLRRAQVSLLPKMTGKEKGILILPISLLTLFSPSDLKWWYYDITLLWKVENPTCYWSRELRCSTRDCVEESGLGGTKLSLRKQTCWCHVRSVQIKFSSFTTNSNSLI